MAKINYREDLEDDILKRVDQFNVEGTIERLVSDIVMDVTHIVCSDIQDILHDVEDSDDCCMRIQDYCMSILCSKEEVEDFNHKQEQKDNQDGKPEN